MTPALAMKRSRREELNFSRMARRMVSREDERSHCMKVTGQVGAWLFASVMTLEPACALRPVKYMQEGLCKLRASTAALPIPDVPEGREKI